MCPHVFCMFLVSMLVFQKLSTFSTAIYTYPKELTVQKNKDLVYQLNSTLAISSVRWGLWKTDGSGFDFIFFTNGLLNSSLPSVYMGRLGHFGNISKGQAWYKLRNISLKDSGAYGIKITAHGQSQSFLKTNLIVTETPVFTDKPNALTIITEHKDLFINCSAIGSPTPNVRWINVSNNTATVNQGNGFAVLKIPKITRHYDGQIYKCQAENNPNEEPSETSTVLLVEYKPSIDLSSSNITGKSWEGNIIKLRCKWLDSLPEPTWSWYNPNGILISSNIIPIDKGSEVTLTTGSSNGDYGLYTCKAINEAGSVSHSINVTRLYPPGSPNVTVSNVDGSSAQVQWTKPVNNGGSQITGYEVEVNQNTYELNAQTLYKIVSDLDNDKLYEVKVWAKNVVGYGNFSVNTFKTKLQGKPALPVLTIVEIQETLVKLRWSKPADNGGVINVYTVYQTEVGVDEEWKQVTKIYGDVRQKTIANLEQGKKYSFIVTASNRFGESPIDDDKKQSVEIPVRTSITTTTTVNVSCVNKPTSGYTLTSQTSGCNLAPVIVLGVLFAVSLTFNVIFLVYFILRHRKGTGDQPNANARPSHCNTHMTLL